MDLNALMQMELSELISTVSSDYPNLDNELDKTKFQALALARAEQLNSKQSITKLFNSLAKAEQVALAEKRKEQFPDGLNLKFDKNGLPQNTIENYINIMRTDPAYANIKYNELTGNAEIHNTGNVRKWMNADISKSRLYIESKYGIFSKDKHRDALNILFNERQYNPILDIITNLTWDEKPRIEEFLVKYGKCDDTPYTREVSRLIFAGGIWRLLEAGCKFDDVPVLCGKQGCGKSSLVRFLAINDAFFGEIKTTDGEAKSVEQLSGKWICEIPELAAFSKAKEVESVKAFITRQRDIYRKPYDELVEDKPRRVMFIGTSNIFDFLTDLSGGRRFYPITVHSNGYELYDQEREIREYIMQCWAEAYFKYNVGEMPNYANRDLVDIYASVQQNSMQDDWRIGAIKSYLAEKQIGDRVCVKEIMTEVISPDPEHPINPTPKDNKDIGIILNSLDEWEKLDSPSRTRWGSQRCWKRISGVVEHPTVEIPSGEELPF